MPDLKSKDKLNFYICGRCSGNIPYLKRKGFPSVCPECGYGHGERSVNDVPAEVRISLRNPSTTGEGSRGITEETTITSR